MAQQAKGMGSRLLHQLAGLGGQSHANDASKTPSSPSGQKPSTPSKAGLFGKGVGALTSSPSHAGSFSANQMSPAGANMSGLEAQMSRFGAQDAQHDISNVSQQGDHSFMNHVRSHLPFGDRMGHAMHGAQNHLPQNELERLQMQQQAQRLAQSQVPYGQPEMPSTVQNQLAQNQGQGNGATADAAQAQALAGRTMQQDPTSQQSRQQELDRLTGQLQQGNVSGAGQDPRLYQQDLQNTRSGAEQ